MGKSKLEVMDIITRSSDHVVRRTDVRLRGSVTDCGIKPGDFVTLTKVEAEPAVKSNDGWIAQIDRVNTGSHRGQSTHRYDVVIQIEQDLQFQAGESVTLLCRPDEFEEARAILEATEAEKQTEAMRAVREAVEPDSPQEKMIKVDVDGSALETLVVNKGDNVLLIREYSRQEVDATRLAAIADTLSSLPIPINLSWMKYAVDDLRSIANRIRDIP